MLQQQLYDNDTQQSSLHWVSPSVADPQVLQRTRQKLRS